MVNDDLSSVKLQSEFKTIQSKCQNGKHFAASLPLATESTPCYALWILRGVGVENQAPSNGGIWSCC